MMRIVVLFVVVLALLAGVWVTVDFDLAVQAQGHSNDPNVLMLDNCSTTDAAYVPFGGCPEGGSTAFKAHQGDVTVAEFLDLLVTTLAPVGHIIGHPSWRNEPSYVTIRAGQTVKVSNRGGRSHTFTEVANFGGGFIPGLNGALTPAPECGADLVPNPAVKFVAVGQTQQLSGIGTGLRKFQCCIHPWMRAAIRVQ